MKIKSKLRSYKSSHIGNLSVFKYPAMNHNKKTWTSKDGRVFLIREMDTMHLWNTYRMLLKIVESGDKIEEAYENVVSFMDSMQGEMACYAAERELKSIHEFLSTVDIARNALQYIGHELYKREVGVPKLPPKNLKEKINRADNLYGGFEDNKTKLNLM